MHFHQLFLRIAHERYHFLKFILEGYDGICLLSTVPGTRGCVCLRYPAERKKDLFDLLTSLAFSINPAVI